MPPDFQRATSANSWRSQLQNQIDGVARNRDNQSHVTEGSVGADGIIRSQVLRRFDRPGPNPIDEDRRT
jgi:hypothetical protein